jgi:hypothetical protein
MAAHNRSVRVLLLAMALLGLVAVAPRDHVGARGVGAPGGPPALPRGWATDRLRRVTAEFPRVDRIEAKLTTQAEWSGASGTGPFPARPTRAPGSVPAVVAGPTPVVPADATERLVWVVAASGEVQPPLLVGRGSSRWGVLILDARTGEALGMAAGGREAWPPSWDRVVDRSAGAEWVLGPAAGAVVPREEAERRVSGGTGHPRSWLLPAASAARAAGMDRLPAWLDPRRDVWLVAIRDERAGLAGEGYALVDGHLGAVLVAGQAARIDAPD